MLSYLVEFLEDFSVFVVLLIVLFVRSVVYALAVVLDFVVIFMDIVSLYGIGLFHLILLHIMKIQEVMELVVVEVEIMSLEI